MIIARFFIGDEPIEYAFDETASINNAIDHLAMLYYEKMGKMPMGIFLSPDLYKLVLTQNVRFHTQMPMDTGFQAASFHTSVGMVMVKIVSDPKERFIYAGDQAGYENALIDKRFEEIVFGVEDESNSHDSSGCIPDDGRHSSGS